MGNARPRGSSIFTIWSQKALAISLTSSTWTQPAVHQSAGSQHNSQEISRQGQIAGGTCFHRPPSLNYVSSQARSVAFVTVRDRCAGASRANKGLGLLWPALQPVTRCYLLHALFLTSIQYEWKSIFHLDQIVSLQGQRWRCCSGGAQGCSAGLHTAVFST